MKFGFVTCVQLGLDCIEEIYSIGGTLDVLFTLEDGQAREKSGRIYLDDFASEHGVDLVKARHVSDALVTQAITDRELDWLFIIGWSQIARQHTLDAPSRGCLGIHPTLLPQGRGRAAIPWAILKGLDKTGVTLFKLDAGVDTGPIVAQEEIDLTPTTTATDLYSGVGSAHRSLLRNAWDDLANDRVEFRIQDDSLASEWPGRQPSDGAILPGMTVDQVDKLVRAVTRPYPGAFLLDTAGVRTIVWDGSPSARGSHPPIPCVDGPYWPHHTEVHVPQI